MAKTVTEYYSKELLFQLIFKLMFNTVLFLCSLVGKKLVPILTKSGNKIKQGH